MNIAFKEWAIVVEALGQGAQTVVIRKGGIHESGGRFNLEHNEFLLFPTQFHQQREWVTREAQHRFDQPPFPLNVGGNVPIAYAARVIAAAEVHDLGAIKRLRNLHIWSEELLAQRFAWNEEPMVHALFLEVSRLCSPIDLPMKPAYSGCKSWIELETPVDTSNSTSVLSPSLLQENLLVFTDALRSPSQK